LFSHLLSSLGNQAYDLSVIFISLHPEFVGNEKQSFVASQSGGFGLLIQIHCLFCFGRTLDPTD